MEAKRGYYSLVQYCPDMSRLEAANVGVILFCPEVSFIEAQVAPGNDQPRRFFQSKNVDPDHINAAKAALVERLRVDKESFRKPEDLERFVRTRGNDLLLTQPRPVKVFRPEDDLNRLFQELVGGRRPRRREEQRVPVPELDTTFHHLHLQNRARLSWQVKIPVIGRSLRVPYAYRNGAWNLVKPQVFSGDLERTTTVAMQLAVEGDLLAKRGAEDLNGDGMVSGKLIVVALFEDAEKQNEKTLYQARERVLPLLTEYQVETVLRHQVPTFIERVEREAQPVQKD